MLYETINVEAILSSQLVSGRSCCESCEDEYASTIIVTHQVLSGNGPPTFTPVAPSIAYIYKDLDDGSLWFWDIASQAWV